MGSDLVTGTVSGILGMGFTSIASTNAVPFWEALYNANQFSEPYFSFWVERWGNDSKATDTEPGGVLTLGGANTTLFSGSIEFIDMPSGSTPGYWLQNIEGLTVQGKSSQITQGSSQLSAIDTGTTLIGGPSGDVAAFWANVEGSEALSGSNEGFWSYRASKHFFFSFLHLNLFF